MPGYLWPDPFDKVDSSDQHTYFSTTNTNITHPDYSNLHDEALQAAKP